MLRVPARSRISVKCKTGWAFRSISGQSIFIIGCNYKIVCRNQRFNILHIGNPDVVNQPLHRICSGANPLQRQRQGRIANIFFLYLSIVDIFSFCICCKFTVHIKRSMLRPRLNPYFLLPRCEHVVKLIAIQFSRESQFLIFCNADIVRSIRRIRLKQNLPRLYFLQIYGERQTFRVCASQGCQWRLRIAFTTAQLQRRISICLHSSGIFQLCQISSHKGIVQLRARIKIILCINPII